MSVLIFVDTADGHVKKASLECLSYGAKLAEQTGTTAEGVVLGSSSEDLSALGRYDVKKIHHVNDKSLDHFDAQVFTDVRYTKPDNIAFSKKFLEVIREQGFMNQ